MCMGHGVEAVSSTLEAVDYLEWDGDVRKNESLVVLESYFQSIRLVGFQLFLLTLVLLLVSIVAEFLAESGCYWIPVVHN